MGADIYDLMAKKMLPKFNELDEHCFIWLPLANVPIDEHLPVNSMHQPALKIFNLLTWTAVAPFATDEQKFMRELALKHEEMGYFLLHYQDIFGIIGVEEYRNGWKPGRAVVFNGIDTRYYKRNHAVPPLMLELVYSELEYPCETFDYAQGEFSNYTNIFIENGYPVSLDD